MKHRRGLLLAALLPATAAAQATAPARDLSALSRDLQALSERVKPAVVQVLVTGYAPADGQLGVDSRLLFDERSHTGRARTVVSNLAVSDSDVRHISHLYLLCQLEDTDRLRTFRLKPKPPETEADARQKKGLPGAGEK